MTRAVITGVGVVSAFGVGTSALLDGLATGRCAVDHISSFDASEFPVRVAGEVLGAVVDGSWVREHSGLDVTSEHERGVFRDRKAAFALVAANEAWASAHAGESEKSAWLSIGLGLEQAFLPDFVGIFQEGRINWSADVDADLPHNRYRSAVNMAADTVADRLQLQGPIVVHASACAAGVLAVAHAASLVERGLADVVLCGAADSMVHPMGLGGFSRLGAPSPRHSSSACRPFDSRRDGLVIGEGAAMFVVESETRARRRGASVFAQIFGWGSTQDAYRATAPRPDGECAAQAMTQAMRHARIDPGDIDYINAHGTGTPLNDPAEVRAIRTAFGPHADDAPVSSIKGAIGHAMAASGALEIAACLLPFVHDLLPGTANHQRRDPDCDLDIIGETPRAAKAEIVLSNSFGFGGQNTSIVLGRPENVL